MEIRTENYQQRSKPLVAVLCVVALLSLSSLVNANEGIIAQTVTTKRANISLNELIWELQKQTDFTFIYNSTDIQDITIGAIDADNEEVTTVLDKCLAGSGLEYNVHNGVIAIKKAPEASAAVQQQKITITGKVLDNDGEGAPGANILIKGTSQGVSTDIDGNFTLDIEAGTSPILVITYIGFATQEVKAETSRPMLIRLNADDNLLEEVIITAYGTFKKSAYAGSASVVRTEDKQDIPTLNFQEMLEGSAPGVSITSSSGMPGSSTTVNIRGMGSINSSTQPLYVIDGVPVMRGDIGTSSNAGGLDVMATINASDIESITVIKDAAAASLYGSRAANGVIVITTKQGNTGKPSFTFKADWGFSDFAMGYRKLMGGQERRDVIYEGLKNYVLVEENGTLEEAIAHADANIDTYAPVPWCGFVNWDDHMFQTGHRDNYEFSGSGGNEKMKYYTSLSYLKQNGVAINSGMERISGRVNVDYKMNHRLTLGAKISFARINQDGYNEGTGYTTPIYGTRNGATPSDPIWNEDGTWNRDLIKLDDRNPLLSQTYNYDREKATRSFNTIYGLYDIYKGLQFKTTFSYDFVLNKSKSWRDPRTSDADEGVNGKLSSYYSDYNTLSWSNLLTYQTKIKQDHNIDVLGGYEIYDYHYDYLRGTVSNFSYPNVVSPSTGTVYEAIGGYDQRYRLVSYITRANYDYKGKYFLGGSWRMDGSSRLAKNGRWGNFWSVSGAWRIIEEQFMEPVKEVISDLKLRASYGVNGTLPSSYYGYLGLTTLKSDYNDNPGMAIYQQANNDLTWESNHNLNIGLDMGFFNNRLNFSLEYYTRTTKDLLYDLPISYTTGFSSYLSNIGKLRNKGVELEISSKNIQTKSFRWSTSFNLGHNRNKVVNLDGDLESVISGQSIHKIGLPYRTYYMIEFAGIDPEDGLPQFYTNTEDENGKLVKELTKDPNNAEKIIYKDADFDITGGINNNLKYKWVDLNFTFNYGFGGWSYDNGAQKLEHGGDGNLNIPTYYRDRWQNPGDETSIERYIVGRSISMSDWATTRRVHSRDFVRLKSLTLGVTIPKNLIREIGLERVRVFASGTNLWTWAAYKNYDPEIGRSVSWETPPMRTITFGLEVNF